MALTNIELYEALKKDVSEEAARMIAEVVPKAGDLATQADIAATRADVAAVRADVARVEHVIGEVKAEAAATEARLKSYIDSRLMRLTLMVVVPMWISMLGTAGALVTLIAQQH